MSTQNTNKNLTLAELQTLKQKFLVKDWDKETYIKVDNYEELSVMIDSLISVCQSTLLLLFENRQNTLNDWEHQQTYKSTPLDVLNVLQLVKDITPIREMEFLDKISDLN